MSKNNTIIKSDKKYIARQKAVIRRTVLDSKKQQEMIDALYARFMPKAADAPKAEPKKVVENVGAKKEAAPKAKKEKVVASK